MILYTDEQIRIMDEAARSQSGASSSSSGGGGNDGDGGKSEEELAYVQMLSVLYIHAGD